MDLWPNSIPKLIAQYYTRRQQPFALSNVGLDTLPHAWTTVEWLTTWGLNIAKPHQQGSMDPDQIPC